MCGICGIIKFNKQPVEESKIRKMMARMKHRGPDDEGVFMDGNVGLGFVRLSILDLSPLGHQPMFDDAGRYVIIYNGEVYNYIEIRYELIKKGYSFKSNTDTEVVLKSYLEWGEECLNRFNGMWAFCIYDTQTKRIFISRDRYGVKPFYYYLDNEQFVFASEIPSILKVLDIKSEPNKRVIFDYLVFNRTDQTELTFFEGIKKLQHGNILSIDSATVKINKWYDLRERVDNVSGFRSPLEYKELLSSAIGLRLRSDVPVGVCLSGGLDSSSIVSILLEDFNKYDLNTFSAIYSKYIDIDESEFIDEYEPKLKNMFFTTPSVDTLLSDIKKYISCEPEPIPSTGPYAHFKVMELAKNRVVVTLDGQGADESLAGYHYFYGLFFKELLKTLAISTLAKEIIAYIALHKSLFAFKTLLFFLIPSKMRTSLRAKKIFKNSFVKKYSSKSTVSDTIYGSISLKAALIDHFEFKLEHLLKWQDHNSMFFSLESRVPFLDYRLVEKTLASTSDNLIKRGWTKSILRESMKGILPEKIRLRKDKNGFETPLSNWFFDPQLIKLIKKYLNEGKYYSDIFDKKVVSKLLDDHLSKKNNNSKELWKYLSLNLWHEMYIDGSNNENNNS